MLFLCCVFFFSSRRRHTRCLSDWSSDVCSSDLEHPEQIVVVSGHLDSWDLGTGAIDDGAGVAVSMETLHLIKQLGLRPKRSEERRVGKEWRLGWSQCRYRRSNVREVREECRDG